MHTSPLASPGSADAGGMNVVELNSALALARRGHQVELITRWDDPSLEEVVDVADGVRVVNLRAGEPRLYAKSMQEELIDPFRDALRVHLRTSRPDIVHSHHWFSGVAALPITKEMGVPHVQTYHSLAAPEGAGLSEGEAPESPGRRPGEQLAARESDLIIAVSETERGYICTRYGVPCQELVVVHPGVDIRQFRPLAPGEKPWRPRPDVESYLVFAARLQPLKGPDLAISALAALPPQGRPHLLVIGEVSADYASYLEELLDLAHEKDVAGRVVFLGSQGRDDLAMMLRSAEMLIMPSYSETFGLIALEAQASGIPVVATHAGGLPEAVREGETGVLLDSRSPDEWAAAVQGLLADPSAKAEMGRKAREYACTLTWDDTAQALENAYLGLSKGVS